MNTTVSYRETLAVRLRQARGERTLKEVSIATGINIITISRYERNKREIGLENLCKLAKFYGEEIDYLVGLKDY